MCVFYNSRFKCWLNYLRRAQTKKTVETEEAQQECRVLLIKIHRRLTSIAVFTVHTETSQLYTFQRTMQAK